MSENTVANDNLDYVPAMDFWTKFLYLTGTMQWIIEMDQSLFFLINTQLTNAWFDVFFPFITDLHKNIYFVAIVYPLIIFMLIKKYALKKGLLIFLFCVLNLATIDLVGNYLFKKQFERLRPGDNPAVHAIVRSPYGGFSFISNHSANIFGFALYMGFFLVNLRVLFFLIAVLIGFSRVYNGVHFPTDILVGGLVGLIIAYGYVKLYFRVCEHKKAVAE